MEQAIIENRKTKKMVSFLIIVGGFLITFSKENKIQRISKKNLLKL
jgi:hypothetical protein